MYFAVTIRCNLEILHCYGVFAWHHKLFKPESTFKKIRADFFYRKIMTPFLK